MFNSPNKSIGVIKGIESAPGKNILINGNFTVNQYGSDLDAQYAVTSADDYYIDRWVKRAGNRITQLVEEGNYEPSTEYTLSCYRQNGSRESVTANSPVSGHWDIGTTHNLALYFTDRKIQMEKGDTATDFELEDIGTTTAKCQRYYWNGQVYTGGVVGGGGSLPHTHHRFNQRMRDTPSWNWIGGGICSDGFVEYYIDSISGTRNESVDGIEVLWHIPNPLTAGRGCVVRDATVAVDAELR